MHKRGLCRHAVSVRLSVCPLRLWITSKRIKISSNFFHHRVATPVAGAASAALAACPSTSRVRGCMPVTSVAGWSGTRLHSRHPPRSLRTVIAVNYVQSPPGHASLHGRTTTSAIEASMLQAPRVEQFTGAPATRHELRVSSVSCQLKTFLFGSS